MRGGAALTAVLALLAGTASTGTASTGVALAASACASRPAPAQMIREVPWPQRRFEPERLAPLATGAGIIVAVIDSGVDRAHPQLTGQVLAGADYLDRRGDGRLDCVGHGTAVASIIAGHRVARAGLRGLAPGAKILPVRVSEQQIIDGQATGDTVNPEEFGAAIRWAVDHGADVLNLSVVSYVDSPRVRSAVRYAVEHDVVVIAAVGNLHGQGGDLRPYPASYDGVLGVAAIGPDGMRQPDSQIGSYVDISAPGARVVGAMPGGGHRMQEGTSYAVPFVAATAALVREYWPMLSAKEVALRILATADPAPGGRDSDAYGSGVVNPYRALTEEVATGVPQRARPLAAKVTDPAAAVMAQREAHTRRLALALAAGGVVLAAVALLCGLVLPRGARRRWRPAAPIS
jgi:type VII secretion-associated serine protease mycosin